MAAETVAADGTDPVGRLVQAVRPPDEADAALDDLTFSRMVR